MLRQQIIDFCQKKYNGSFRFLKEKMFAKQFGKQALNTILEYNTFLVEDHPLPVKIYNYIHNIDKQPTCKHCSMPVKYNSNKNWLTFCSIKCRSHDVDVLAKRKATNIIKYGATNFLASEQGKQKTLKSHIDRYGVSHYNKTDEYAARIKSGDISRAFDKDKYRRSVRTKFYRDLYNITPTLTPLFDEEYFIVHGAGSYHEYDWQCKVCTHRFKRWLNIGMRPICPNCAPKGTEHEIIIKNFLHKHNIEFVFRNRKLLDNNLEIDIFIPSKNIGIEIDGLFYHREQNVGKRYHLDKTIMASNKGVRLIHIFGDEMHRKQQIVLSRLKHILHLHTRSVYARKCVVKEISNTLKSKFFEKYHIQGDGNGSIHLGLFYKTRLVAVMDFGKQRPGIGKAQDDAIELIRFATIAHFNVVGGASKLLKHFINKYNPTKIVSYADRRWSTGHVYEQLGFKLVSTSQPNYWYTKNFTERLHRIGFQRNLLEAKLPVYDPSLSERDNMLNNKFYRVYDCGTLRYELIPN